ncbi:hypothetical protein TSUD_191100 [Trifolium subterraneum]|uniref:RNase H type-1 domain-containing protein n=1 Tax=Trifolium subterraneum TaxID=3900 RepID=A0A2Z6P814_TRISU|nr:hypothetical protein TSUD_191100 [Trifolium subterraneum]
MTTSTTSDKNKWTIFVDGSSNLQESGAGIILENGDGVLIEVSLGLSFRTTNNQAEYEAFLVGLRLAEDTGAEEIKIYTDSQLVASQVSGKYQTKEERLLEYLHLIKEKLAKFKETEVKHVPREHNSRADVLSKLASTRHKKAGNARRDVRRMHTLFWCPFVFHYNFTKTCSSSKEVELAFSDDGWSTNNKRFFIVDVDDRREIINRVETVLVDGTLAEIKIAEEWGYALGEDTCLFEDESDSEASQPDVEAAHGDPGVIRDVDMFVEQIVDDPEEEDGTALQEKLDEHYSDKPDDDLSGKDGVVEEETHNVILSMNGGEYSSPLALPRDFTIITKDYNPSAQAHKQESSIAQNASSQHSSDSVFNVTEIILYTQFKSLSTPASDSVEVFSFSCPISPGGGGDRVLRTGNSCNELEAQVTSTIHKPLDSVMHHVGARCFEGTIPNSRCGKHTKSCPPSANRSGISGPWSLEWLHDHNHGDAGVDKYYRRICAGVEAGKEAPVQGDDKAAEDDVRGFGKTLGVKFKGDKEIMFSVLSWTIRCYWGLKAGLIEAAFALHCKVGKIPFLYLGLPIGGDSRRLGFWELSILTSLSVYALSFFKAPSARYGVERGRLRAGGRSGSSWWREIVRIRDGGGEIGGEWFEEHISKQVGDGSDSFFWTDPWANGTLLCERFRRMFELVETQSCTMAEMATLGWGSGGGAWVWYSLQIDGSGSLILTKVPVKVSILAWRLLGDTLPTNANLVTETSYHQKLITVYLAVERWNRLNTYLSLAALLNPLVTHQLLDWIFVGGRSDYT